MNQPSPAAAPDEASFELFNEREQIEQAEKALLAALERQRFDGASIFAIRLAFEEGVVNAFRHGHKELPDKPIQVSWKVKPHEVAISITDQGPGFDPEDVPDPTLDANLEIPSGRGIMLIRAYMTEVAFNDQGNSIQMRYEFSAETR